MTTRGITGLIVFLGVLAILWAFVGFKGILEAGWVVLAFIAGYWLGYLVKNGQSGIEQDFSYKVDCSTMDNMDYITNGEFKVSSNVGYR